MFPTNAKMTAFVWSGRMRPNAKCGSKFAGHHAICSAASAPTSMPTMPHPIDAKTNQRETLSLNSIRFVSSVSVSQRELSASVLIVVILFEREECEAVRVFEVALATGEDKE